MSLYTPILVLGAIASVFAVVSVVTALVIGPRRYNRSKLAAYECGIEPVVNVAVGQRFPIKYYLTAMLFIVFDIEIVFLYPWAVAFDQLGTFALVEMALFMGAVFVAYAYIWRRGGLEWDYRNHCRAGSCCPPWRRSPGSSGPDRCGRRPSAWRAAPSR